MRLARDILKITAGIRAGGMLPLLISMMLEAERSSLISGEPWPASMTAFFKADGSAYQPGETLIQPDLAASLKQIAEQGSTAFYEGDIARKLVADMQAHHGLITLDDLKNYRAVVRAPRHAMTGGCRPVRRRVISCWPWTWAAPRP